MRWSPLILFIALSTLLTGALAWTTEDHEIFDLVSALEAAEGPKTSFYSFMNVSSSATPAELSKAYKKRSLELHPDRGGDAERFARLGVINTILKDKEKRKRYHHFYVNGVPKWRGTGYYYARYRPGLGTVLVFLSILSLGVQYLAQHLTRYSEVQRILRFQNRAKRAAWGNEDGKPPADISPSTKRKVRVALGDNPNNTVGMTVEANGKVCIVDESGEVHPLDAAAARQPSFSSTWIPSLVRSAYRKVSGKPSLATDGTAKPSTETSADLSADESDAVTSGAATPTGDGPVNRRQRRAEAKQKLKQR